MGYHAESVSVVVPVLLSRHNDERDEEHNALAEELQKQFDDMTRSILMSGKYDAILTNGSARIPVDTLGVSDDVTLTLNSKHGVLYHLPLRMTALIAVVNDGEIMPFVYDRHVPDEDEEPVSALRRARLMIVDDGPLFT